MRGYKVFDQLKQFLRVLKIVFSPASSEGKSYYISEKSLPEYYDAKNDCWRYQHNHEIAPTTEANSMIRNIVLKHQP